VATLKYHEAHLLPTNTRSTVRVNKNVHDKKAYRP